MQAIHTKSLTVRSKFVWLLLAQIVGIQMVNTFLPFPDYNKSAKALDVKRLGKQRVEALQILKANLGKTQGWRNHPAAVMWRGYEGQLFLYTVAICERWIKLGYKDTCLQQAMELCKEIPADRYKRPWWLGKRAFHRSHRSNLKRKDITHYKFPGPDDLPYVWPREDGKSITSIKKKEE